MEEERELGKRLAETVFKRIDALLHGRGYGWIRKAEKIAGRKRGCWLNRRLKFPNMWLSEFLGICAALGLHPVRFLEETLAGELGGDGLAGLKLARPLCEPRILRLVERREEAATDERRDWGIRRPYVEDLDRLRYSAPERVVTLAEDAVAQVEPSVLPLLLGVTASAYRTAPVPRLDEAMLTLKKALELARGRGDRLAEADLVRRVAYVVAANGAYASALDIAAKATMIYLRAHDLAGVGRTMVDRAMFFDYMGDIEAAIAEGEASLTYLPEEEEKHRFAAFQGLGLCYQRKGDLERARKYAGAAAKLLPGLDPCAQGDLLWLLAGVSRSQNRLVDAERQLRQVVEIFWQVYPLNAAIASVDLVEVQILRGHHAKAIETAKGTGELMAPLRGNKLARAALTDLIRASHETRPASGWALTLTAVEGVRRKLEHVRTRCQALC